MNLVRFSYGIAYRIGLAPWNTFMTDTELARLVEGPARLPPAKALDLGCGTGRNAIYLAQHGWDVTAVDLVEKAVASTRRGAEKAGVRVRVIAGDVTRPEETGIGDGFRLLVDFGCYHAVPDGLKDKYAAAVTRVAAPEATLWMWAFGSSDPKSNVVRADELRVRFTDWELRHAAPMDGDEIRAVFSRLPLVQRPLRTALLRGWAPHPWRFRLERHP
jgi:SAM-dependent methyltransferase